MPKKGKAKSRKEISPLSPKKLQKVFKQCGFEIVRQESTHVTMKHPDVPSIVNHPDSFERGSSPSHPQSIAESRYFKNRVLRTPR